MRGWGGCQVGNWRPEVEGSSCFGQAMRGESQDVVSVSVMMALGHHQVW